MVPVAEVEIADGDGDSALADRIRVGDRAAENELVLKYSGRVLAMLVARLRNRETARELTDDVLMAAVTALRRGSVHETTRLGAFIHGVALNVANGHQRTSGRKLQPEVMEDDVADVDSLTLFERHDDLQAVRQGVARLSAGDQEILLLTLVEGLKPGEIALRLGLSPEVVRQRKSRALQVLRTMFDGPSRTRGREPQSDR